MAVGRAKSPRVVGRYQLVHELAQGYLGPLWAVRVEGVEGSAHLAMLRLVSLAKLDADTRVRLLEGAWQAMEVRHDRVSPVSDVVASDGELGIISDYAEGLTLRALQSLSSVRRKPMPTSIAVRIVLDLVEAVAALHSAALELGDEAVPLYGGLSADSLFVGADGRASVLDVVVASVASSIESLGGNPERSAYAAPEQLTFPPRADARTDVFAIGILAWECLSNRRLFIGQDRAVVQKVLAAKIPRLDEVKRPGDPIVPEPLLAAVMRALQRDPAGRFTSVAELGSAIAEAGVVAAEPAQVAEYVELLGEGALGRVRDALKSAASGTRPITASKAKAVPPAEAPSNPARAPAQAAPAPPASTSVDGPSNAPTAAPPAAPPGRGWNALVGGPPAARAGTAAKPGTPAARGAVRPRMPTMIGIVAPTLPAAAAPPAAPVAPPAPATPVAPAAAPAPTPAASAPAQPAARVVESEAPSSGGLDFLDDDIDSIRPGSPDEATAQYATSDLVEAMEQGTRRAPTRDAEFSDPPTVPRMLDFVKGEEAPTVERAPGSTGQEAPTVERALGGAAPGKQPPALEGSDTPPPIEDGGWLDAPESPLPRPAAVPSPALMGRDARPAFAAGSASSSEARVARAEPTPAPAVRPSRSLAPPPSSSPAAYFPSQIPPPLIHDPRARVRTAAPPAAVATPETSPRSRGVVVAIAVCLAVVLGTAAIAIVALRQHGDDPAAPSNAPAALAPAEPPAAPGATIAPTEALAPAPGSAAVAPATPELSASAAEPRPSSEQPQEQQAPATAPAAMPKATPVAPTTRPVLPARRPPKKKQTRYVPNGI